MTVKARCSTAGEAGVSAGVRTPAMANGRCRMHGGKVPGAPRGDRHAWKHGRYSREAIERRREVAELIRTMHRLAHQLGT